MMEEQPLDLRGTVKAVRKHRLLVALLVVTGLAAGIAYGLKTSPMPEATTLVLLPPTAITSSPGVSPYTKTQEIIVASESVLASASRAVTPPAGISQLKDDLTVVAPSQDVLQISVKAASYSYAERLANAVAASYISYVDGIGSGTQKLLGQLSQEAKGFTSRILKLQSQIDGVQSRLAREGPGSVAGRRDSSLLSSLNTAQEQLSIQLNDVNSQLVSSQFSATQSDSATQLIQRAEPVRGSGERLPMIALLGALAGLVAACVLSVAIARGDRRLRTRDAIATAIGVPVRASVWAKRCKSAADWRRLLESDKSFSSLELWNARRLYQRLIVAGGMPEVDVRLLALPGDEAAAPVGVRIARAAAMLGMSSQLEIADQSMFAPLRAACIVTGMPVSGSAMVAMSTNSVINTEFSGCAATVRLSVLDLAEPAAQRAPGNALLIVSSGFATSADLARAALAISDAGSDLAGVIVANPDRDDHSAGLLPERSEPPVFRAPSLNVPLARELAGRDPK